MTRKEEIEKASVDYQMSKHPIAIGGDAFADMIYKMNINPSFIAGAEWADKTMIDKVCKWLEEQVTESDENPYVVIYQFDSIQELIEDLRKAMEE